MGTIAPAPQLVEQVKQKEADGHPEFQFADLRTPF